MTVLTLVCCVLTALKIGVFDSGNGETSDVNKAIVQSGASSWLQSVTVGYDDVVGNVVAAHNNGVVGFIGPASSPLASVAGYICTSRRTPLLTSSTPLPELSNQFSFITNVLPAVEDHATAILNFASNHSLTRVSVVYDNSVDSRQLALQVNKQSTSEQHIWLHELPRGEADISNYFLELKIRFGQLVVIMGSSSELLAAAKKSGLVSTGRAWLLAGTAKGLVPEMSLQERISYMGLLHLRVSNESGSQTFMEASSLIRSLSSAYPELPSVGPWSHGDVVFNSLIKNKLNNISLEIANFDAAEWKVVSSQTGQTTTVYRDVLWPGNSKVTSNRPLVGRTLKVLFIIAHPFMQFVDGKPTGFIWELQEHIRLSLGYNVTASFQDGNWTQALYKLDQYDMVCGDITINEFRETLADFTQPFVETSDSMIMLRPKMSTSYWQVFYPFRVTVWFTWVGVMFVAAIVFYIVEKDSENEYLTTGHLQTTIETCIWWSFTAMLSVNEGMPVTRAGRLLTAAVFFLSLVFIATYTAELAAMLSIKVATYYVDDFDEIQNGQIVLSEVAVPADSSNELRLGASLGRKGYVIADDPGDMVDKIKLGKVRVGIFDGIWNRYAATSDWPDCSLEVHGSPFNNFGLGFALPRDSVYTTFVSEHILKLKEAGEIERLIEKYLTGSCTEQSEEEGVHQLEFSAFVGVYLVYAMALIIVLITHFVEKKLLADGKIKIPEPEAPKCCQNRKHSRANINVLPRSMSPDNEVSSQLLELSKQISDIRDCLSIPNKKNNNNNSVGPPMLNLPGQTQPVVSDVE